MSVRCRLMLQRERERVNSSISPTSIPDPSVHSVVRSSCFFQSAFSLTRWPENKMPFPTCLLTENTGILLLSPDFNLTCVGSKHGVTVFPRINCRIFSKKCLKAMLTFSLSTDSGWNPPSMILIKTLLSNEEPKQTYTTMAPGQLC